MILNLGCGTPGALSWHPMDGAVNLDKSMGWCFEDGLKDYADGSVDGVTVSHAIMYVAITDWPYIFSEFARVLRDEGVVRITEDDTQDTRSRTYKIGWHDAVTLTHAAMVKAHLEAAGLVAYDVAPNETHFRDDSLIQQQHGDPPNVFFCEGRRMTRVLFEPHADDAALFASFTVLRYRPMIVTCYPSPPEYGETAVRAAETEAAMSVMGGGPCVQWNGGDLVARMRELDTKLRPSKVFAPSPRASHPDHVAVAGTAAEVFGDRLVRYHTYDAAGKVRAGTQVEFEPVWVQQKLRALARYTSQIQHPRACHFFTADLLEYIDE